jgi:hypothetical protein
MRKCPICSLLDGKFISGSNYCDNCKNTFDVLNAYRMYEMYRSILLMIRFVYWGGPLIIVVQTFLMIFRDDFRFSAIIAVLFADMMWGYNIYKWYHIDKVPVFGKWEKLENMKDKVFLAKLAGHPNLIGDGVLTPR